MRLHPDILKPILTTCITWLLAIMQHVEQATALMGLINMIAALAVSIATMVWIRAKTKALKKGDPVE